MVGHERPLLPPRELVGRSAQAEKWKGACWGWVEEGVWVLTKASNQAGNGRRKELDVGGGAAALAARRWPIPVGVGLGRARGCSEEMEGKARRSWSRGIRMGRHGWPARRSARQSA